MRTVVTGVAGFIGSTLADSLLEAGHKVTGIDAFTDYYNPEAKRKNLAGALSSEHFELITADLTSAVLQDFLSPEDTVFHLAGQPGVRASWGEGFREYVDWNVTATQRLLEACRDISVKRFVYSSSSSLYGSATTYPTSESALPKPVSPYGVTKLAAEHLTTLYGTNFGLSTVSLRYFTVYGPRQRPDMAHHRLINCALNGDVFQLNGDGSQIRDFTFISDAVRANMLAAEADVAAGSSFNIGGGSMASLQYVIDQIEDLVGASIATNKVPRPPGDPDKTGADISQAEKYLNWTPSIDLPTGIAQQVAWHQKQLSY
jgi:nucleoside-diphosphate-sugar epimerase